MTCGTSRILHTRHTSVAKKLVPIIFLSGAFISATSTASAHVDLVSTSPSDGATLLAPLESVELVFDAPPLNDLVSLSILDSDQELIETVSVDRVRTTGNAITFDWPTVLESGEYSVAYRTVAADGHPTTGLITFDISSSETSVPDQPTSPSQPSSTVAPKKTPTPSNSVNDGVNQPDAAENLPDAPFDEGAPNQSLIGPLLIAAAIIVGIGVIVSLVMLARSRR